ncbi:DUF4286 family protein [soil metagenome]
MILYNVTVSIDSSIENEWIEWIREVHIPDLMKTGLFSGNKIMRLLDPKPDDGTNTYAVQYFLNSIEDYDIYLKEHSASFQEKHNEKFKEKFMAFRTVLEIL